MVVKQTNQEYADAMLVIKKRDNAKKMQKRKFTKELRTHKKDINDSLDEIYERLVNRSIKHKILTVIVVSGFSINIAIKKFLKEVNKKIHPYRLYTVFLYGAYYDTYRSVPIYLRLMTE